MVTGVWYTHNLSFGSLSWFWRCKEHWCPLSPHFGLWSSLEVLDWGLTSWSWFGYGHWSLMYLYSEFWLSILILKVQRTYMSFKSSLGALEDAGGSWLGFVILILIWRCKQYPCPLSPHLGIWRMLEAPHWGLASLSWFWYDQWSLIHPWSEFWLSILILKVQRTSMSFKSSFGALDDAWSFWLEFGILILIWI